jgi:hypothetical protein
MELASLTDNPAMYAIRVSDRPGPLLLSSLRRAGVVYLDTSVSTSTVNLVCSDVDLVGVAERFAECGMEIESLVEVSADR